MECKILIWFDKLKLVRGYNLKAFSLFLKFSFVFAKTSILMELSITFFIASSKRKYEKKGSRRKTETC